MDPLEPRSTQEEEEHEATRDEYWAEMDRLEMLIFASPWPQRWPAPYNPESPLLNPEGWVDDLPF